METKCTVEITQSVLHSSPIERIFFFQYALFFQGFQFTVLKIIYPSCLTALLNQNSSKRV